nr:uncharacterized protein LOC109173079 [Ipomoea batatas]
MKLECCKNPNFEFMGKRRVSINLAKKMIPCEWCGEISNGLDVRIEGDGLDSIFASLGAFGYGGKPNERDGEGSDAAVGDFDPLVVSSRRQRQRQAATREITGSSGLLRFPASGEQLVNGLWFSLWSSDENGSDDALGLRLWLRDGGGWRSSSTVVASSEAEQPASTSSVLRGGIGQRRRLPPPLFSDELVVAGGSDGLSSFPVDERTMSSTAECGNGRPRRSTLLRCSVTVAAAAWVGLLCFRWLSDEARLCGNNEQNLSPATVQHESRSKALPKKQCPPQKYGSWMLVTRSNRRNNYRQTQTPYKDVPRKHPTNGMAKGLTPTGTGMQSRFNPLYDLEAQDMDQDLGEPLALTESQQLYESLPRIRTRNQEGNKQLSQEWAQPSQKFFSQTARPSQVQQNLRG